MLKFLGAAAFTAVMAVFGIQSQSVQPTTNIPIGVISKNTNCLVSGVCFNNRVLLIKDGVDGNFIAPDDSYLDTTKIINYYSQHIAKEADFLVVFKDWDTPTSVPGAYEIAVNRTDTGMGMNANNNNTTGYNSKGFLKSAVVMPNISLFSQSYIFNSNISGFAHEVGHQWLVYLNYPSISANHYHYKPCVIFDNGGFADLMMDNPFVWQQTSSSTFSSPAPDNNPYNKKFSTLSLYVMGLLPDKAVMPVQVINAGSLNCPFDGTVSNSIYSIMGSTTLIRLSDLKKVYGARKPEFNFTQKQFTVQVALVTHKSSQLRQGDADMFSKYLDAVEKYLPFAFSQRASFTLLKNTSLTNDQNTESLQTYSNNQYGFSFQYPKTYSTTDGKPNSQTVGVWFVWVSNQDQKQVGINVYQSNLTLNGFASNDRNFLANNPGTSSVGNLVQTTVGGVIATKLSYSYSGRTSGNSEIYYVKKGNFVFRIQFNKGADSAIQQEILGHFVFTK